MSDSVQTYELKRPIQFGSDTIKELHFREPIGRDLDDMPVGETVRFKDLRIVAARLTGHPPTVLELIHPKDLEEVMVITNTLLGELDGPPTGASS